MSMNRTILGAGLIDWLIEQGVIGDGRIRRVIIDAVYDRPVRVYVEESGTEGLVTARAPDALLDVVAERLAPAERIEVTGKGVPGRTLRVERVDDAAGA